MKNILTVDVEDWHDCISFRNVYKRGDLLPSRGRQPIFWAFLNDEKELGISIHEMGEEIDNDPIIIQKRISGAHGFNKVFGVRS